MLRMAETQSHVCYMKVPGYAGDRVATPLAIFPKEQPRFFCFILDHKTQIRWFEAESDRFSKE